MIFNDLKVGITRKDTLPLICSILILILLIGASNASKITVGSKGADYSRIQSAINNATSGDVIEVFSGIYNETIFVRKKVELKGIDTGSEWPIINARRSGSAITLEADGITLRGFNLTNSGHCGCGNAGINIASNNSTVFGNNVYKNYYGIYVKPKKMGNRFFLNNILNNNISAFDDGHNLWEDVAPEGLFGLIRKVKGNYYSDYDEPKEGCIDANKDGFCDTPKKINGGGMDTDSHPLVSPVR